MIPANVDWTVVEQANGVTFRWGHCGEDLFAEWAGVLQVQATRSGKLKALQSMPGAPSDLVEKTRRGPVSAFLRAQRFEHTLHASAVARRDKALVCVGASGVGKSTIAERMCRHSGVELLADDTTEIDGLPGGGLQVLPSEAAVWLVPDGALGKAPVRSCRAAERPAALEWIVALSFDNAVCGLEVREMKGADAVALLLPSLVRFEKTAGLWAREFEFLARLVSRGRLVQARRSPHVAADAVAEALSRLLAGGAT